MSSIEKAPFTALEEHPWIGVDKGNEFYEVPGHYDLLVRKLDLYPDLEGNLRNIKAQAELLEMLDTKYGIRNSGFSPVCAEKAMYVVTDVIPSSSLGDLIKDGKEINIEIADRLLSKLITYCSDLIKSGGIMAGDIHGFDQYAVRENEAVLVDVDLFSVPLPEDDQKARILHVLEGQVGGLSEMAAILASKAGDTPAVMQMLELLGSLDAPTSQMKDMIDLMARSIKTHDAKAVVDCVYGQSDWREYLDGGVER